MINIFLAIHRRFGYNIEWFIFEQGVNMAIPVKLQVFEGPLDLLLHLIDKNKVNIYDIPIVLITEQYLEYVNAMDKTDLNVVSEFLVMAATLLDIKSKMLLPAEVNEEGEEEDPRAELVEKLLEYKMYKYMAYELKDRQVDAMRSLYKASTIPPEVEAYREPVDIEKLVSDVTLRKLNDIFNEVMKRQEDKVDKVRSNFGKIEKEEVNLLEKIEYVKEYARKNGRFSFRQLLMESSSKMQVIVTFLAILELMKTSFIRVEQDYTFADIRISCVETV
ncbi:MAG: segregation/condensation protein A [Thermoflexaceae bacterium]|nr:segregation/condensation protein A [Thermoflexaceae bacterium]